MKTFMIFGALIIISINSAWSQSVYATQWLSLGMDSIKSDCSQNINCIEEFYVDDLDMRQSDQDYIVINMTIHSKSEFNPQTNPLDFKLYQKVLASNPFFFGFDVTSKVILSNPQIVPNTQGLNSLKLQFACTFEKLNFRRPSDFIPYFTSKASSCFSLFEKFYIGL